MAIFAVSNRTIKREVKSVGIYSGGERPIYLVPPAARSGEHGENEGNDKNTTWHCPMGDRQKSGGSDAQAEQPTAEPKRLGERTRRCSDDGCENDIKRAKLGGIKVAAGERSTVNGG